MTDRAFCFSLVLAELMVSAVVISPDDLEGVVLAKVMEVAKEIRSDDKNAGALLLGAGRLLAFLGAGEARRERRRRGWWCCRWRSGRRGDGLPGMAFWVACLAASGGLPAGGWAAVIRR